MGNEKYPRTFHLPWSEGCSSDDKKLERVDSFISSKDNLKEIVITEKLDGSNSCLNKSGVYARSHSQIAHHASFDLLKSKHAQIKSLIKPSEQIFGENCFAVHSIEYTQLPDTFFVFGIKQKDLWLSYSDTVKRAEELGLSVVPLLYQGQVLSERELKALSQILMNRLSVYGGPREGLVIRHSEAFSDEKFHTSVAKQIRDNHVQTDDHWMHQPIIPQNFLRIK